MADKDDHRIGHQAGRAPLRSGGPPRAPANSPSIATVIVTSWAIGGLLGGAAAAALIAFNAGGLFDLIAGAGDQVTPVFLFCAGFATLVGALWAAMAVMLLPWHD